MNEIQLGNADTLISDINNEAEGWAGVCFSEHDCEVGEEFKTDAKTDNELGAFFRIISTNPKSLDVLIEALQRAKVFIDNLESKA